MDSQTLLAAARCYVCEGVSESQALGLGLLSSIAVGAPLPPIPPGPPDPGVAEWVARVVAAGGAVPSAATQMVSDSFIKYLKANSIFTKVIVANLFVPDSLTAAYTPLIQGAGFASWVTAGSTGAINDLTINGLKRSATVGDNSFLENNILPGTFMTSGSGHGSVYVSEDSKGAVETEFGCSNGAGTNDFRMFAHLNDNNSYAYIFAQARILTAAITAGNLLGYLCASRTTTTRSDMYFANSGTAHASRANDAVLCASGPSAVVTMKIFADSQNGAVASWSQKRLSAITFGTALTAAESEFLFNAVQQARVSFGGGFS
jgi:hypothetical protein